MKKILMAATAALALAGNPVIAQENAGGSNASEATVGGVGVGTVAAGVVGLAIAGAIVSNNRGNSNSVDIDPTCGEGETLVDGECVPSTTTTVTSTVTTSVTSTMTTPVTVTATTTSL